jgi:hypothetical protein
MISKELNVLKRTLLTIIRVATTIILSKIKEEMMISIRQNFANSLRLKNALKKKNVGELTIE